MVVSPLHSSLLESINFYYINVHEADAVIVNAAFSTIIVIFTSDHFNFHYHYTSKIYIERMMDGSPLEVDNYEISHYCFVR